MRKAIEGLGDSSGKTGWRKTYARKWTPPAQVCGAWSGKMDQTPEQVMWSALDAFGEQSQVDMVLEEGFELGKALLKLRRKKGTVDDVIDEIADGFVTLGQMRLLYGPEAVDERIKVKLARLVRLVADQVQANAEKSKPVKPASRIADLIRDEWPTPQHKQGCNAAFGEQYRCRCGLAEEQAARDEALRLCQLDSVGDTL